MKIAVFHNLPSGGALRVMNEQIHRLKADDIEIYTMSKCTDTSVFNISPKLHKLLRAPFGRLNGFINILNIQEIKRVSKKIADIIDSKSYDVLLVHPCAIVQTPALLQYVQTPTVYYCHEPFRAMHESFLGGGFSAPISDPLRILYHHKAISEEFKSLQSATIVLSNSFYTREYLLREYGIDSQVNYPGIDTGTFAPKCKLRRKDVMVVGRLSYLKNQDFVIRSVALIDRLIRPEVNMVCDISDDCLPILSLAKSLDVSVNVYTGLSDDDLAVMYSNALCVCVASILEPLGLTSLEAMACGTPVVGIAEAGTRETIIDGVNGYLTLRNHKDFAEKITFLLRHPDIADDLGRSGRKLVAEKWSWKNSIDQLNAIFREVV